MINRHQETSPIFQNNLPPQGNVQMLHNNNNSQSQ